MLCDAGALREPILYLSHYFKARRADYYRLLQEVRENGAWEAWMEYFLTGVRDTAAQAGDTAREIMALPQQGSEESGVTKFLTKAATSDGYAGATDRTKSTGR